MIPRPVRGLLFLTLALALVMPPAIAERGGRGGGGRAVGEAASVAAVEAEASVAAVEEAVFHVAAVEEGLLS